jgi:voltage-gated potassium channel
MYFSFVTLTTLGYGEITPLSTPARSLAIGEALTGQLYLAVLLARLVAMGIMFPKEGGTEET